MSTNGLRLRQAHLALFFTRRTSLQTWQNAGILDRELAIYRELVRKGVKVTLFTYGDRRETELAASLPEFQVCYNRIGLNRRLYEHVLPIIHRSVLQSVTVFKTNQINGAHIAVRCSRRFGKPLIARCGYMWSEFEQRLHGSESRQAIDARTAEASAFQQAERCVVTTESMRRSIVNRFPQLAPRVEKVPNYVDTQLFTPSDASRDFDLIYIGRLDASQKNVRSFLKAVASLDVRALVIGHGSETKSWYGSLASRAKVVWQPLVPHHELPAYLNRARLLVLPSLYEGHPKVLLEAMACGCAVLGTEVDGIKEIVNGRNGTLCQTDVDSIRHGITKMLANEEILASCRLAARAYVIENFSLQQIAEMEFKLIKELSHHEE